MADMGETTALLSIREAGLRLRVSTDTVRRYLTSGQIKGFRLPSGVWRVPTSEIERITSADGR
jgi:excisionase family DNA binding protein